MRAPLKTASFSITILVAIAAGCASPERAPAVRAVGSLADTRTELVASRTNIADAVAAISELESRPADLTPAYNRYKNAVRGVERRADEFGETVSDMRLRAADYRAAWSEENAAITDPEIRATADERRQRVLDRYENIDRDGQELRAAYEPFLAQLRDVEKLLASDLTYNGVESARPAFDKAREGALKLQERVDALIADLDEASMRLSPSTQNAHAAD